MPARSILLITSIAFLAVCTDRDDAARMNTTPAAPNVVSLTATEYRFGAPDSIPAGWTTFRLANHGKEVHYGHMVRLEAGKTVRELVDVYAEAIRTSSPRPKWMTRFGGPGAADPGGSANVTQFLEPGSYVWVCPVEDSGGHPHFAKGEFKPFVVYSSGPGAVNRAAAAKADVVIRLLDYSFAVDSPLPPGRHTIRVENAGADSHDLVMMKLAPGKTIDEVRRWFNPERARRPGQAQDPAPPLESLGTGAGGIATIAPGMESFFETTLTLGEYVLICMTTAPDGRSHIEHGMIQHLRVD